MLTQNNCERSINLAITHNFLSLPPSEQAILGRHFEATRGGIKIDTDFTVKGYGIDRSFSPARQPVAGPFSLP
jgi:hypothetical protein